MSNLEQNSYLRIIQNFVKIESELKKPDELVFEFVRNKIVDVGNSFDYYHFRFFKAYDIVLNKEIVRIEHSSSFRPNNESRRFTKPQIKYYFGSVDDFDSIARYKLFKSLKDLYESI